MTWRGVLVVTATGELTATTQGDLDRALESSASPADFWVLDLRGLVRIDSAGLEAISRAGERARARGVELLVVRPSPRVVGWSRPPGKVSAGGPSFVDDLGEAFQWTAVQRTNTERR